MGNIDSHLLAYLAGIIDGEGCLFIQKNNNPKWKSHTLRLQCRMQEPAEPVLLLQKTFSGTINSQLPKHVGYNQNRRMISWVISGTTALEAVRILLPYLLVKKAEAELAIYFCETRKNLTRGSTEEEKVTELNFRDSCYDKMKLLKKTGGSLG